MNYFDILNFNREPFSNSPDPELFFQSTQHVGCLHNLELAIRMKRGLNTVIGEVGTGKTTLCRQLIRRFQEDDDTLAYLILDPYFSTEEEFLRYVAALFQIDIGEDQVSEWQLKEWLKQYLFRKGVDEGKTLVLIIDEGQKISPSCLEILREFLNYETNSTKLLQIVIFAQKEFEQVLDQHPNLADRININYYLKPLNFQDTKAMIRYRLDRASADGRGPGLFSRLALWAVYRKSRGYPRRIITICHKIILSMIIQNRKKAGLALALSAAGRFLPRQPGRSRSLFLIPAAGLMIGGALLIFRPGLPYLSGTEVPTGTPSSPADGKNSPAPVKEPADKAASAADRNSPGVSSPAKTPAQEGDKVSPEILGSIRVGRQDTLGKMIKKVYGPQGFNRENLEKVLAVNPGIENPDLISVGQVISFPDLGLPSRPEGKWWLRVQDCDSLQEAYKEYNRLAGDLPDLLLIPRSTEGGWEFTIMLAKSFSRKRQAAEFLAKLPAQVQSTASPARRP
ncbi:MAG: AAA family ATPase [Desulfurivibrionaceae bacterium]